jgi:hypothetical protein
VPRQRHETYAIIFDTIFEKFLQLVHGHGPLRGPLDSTMTRGKAVGPDPVRGRRGRAGKPNPTSTVGLSYRRLAGSQINAVASVAATALLKQFCDGIGEPIAVSQLG